MVPFGRITCFGSTSAPAQGLAPQGLQGFLVAQGLHGLQGFFAAQGLHGFLAAHGLQGLQGFFAAQGLQGFFPAQGLHGFFAAQGLHGLHGLQGLLLAADCSRRAWSRVIAVGFWLLSAGAPAWVGCGIMSAPPRATPPPNSTGNTVEDNNFALRDFTGPTS